jgi:hypothetical protein
MNNNIIDLLNEVNKDDLINNFYSSDCELIAKNYSFNEIMERLEPLGYIKKKEPVSSENVKFISYSGKWPNLCSGVLVLEIKGKRYSFGYSADYPSFWVSGGCCGFSKDYEESYVENGPWELDSFPDKYPEEITNLLPEIMQVFNANVPHGCCGGCL